MSRGEAQVGLQVEAGLDGVARAGYWSPVQVTATNSGEPVVGRLLLGMTNEGTVLPLELPSAANKRVESLLIPRPAYGLGRSGVTEATAALMDERREVARAATRLRLLAEGEQLLVVCGEEAGGLRFMQGVPLVDAGWALPLDRQMDWEFQPTAAAHPAPARMPAVWAGYQAADLLVIRDAAWQRLEPEQRRAVRRWVEMEGKVVLCGEDADGFQDEEGRRLLPIEPTGPRPLVALTSFPLPGREPLRAPAGLVMTVAARPRPGARVVRIEAGSPLVVTRPTGFGMVLWVGFDPFRVPPESVTSRRALWAYLISHATGAPKLDPSFPHLADVPAASEPVERLPRFPAPSRWTIGSFGLAYVLLFGPVNIWLLRRLRRTVRAWLLMPALSLLLTGGVLTLGSAWGTTQVVFHTLSVLETVSGSGTAREQNLAALFSPTNRVFSLEIEDPAPALRFLSTETAPERSYPGAPAWNQRHAGPGVGITPGFRDGDLCRWERIGFTLWTIQRFATERAADLGGGVRLELDRRLTGRVVNDMSQPLRRAYLQYPGWRYSLGDLAPGAAKAIGASGWQRRRPPAETADTSASRPTGGPARQTAPGTPEPVESGSGSNLFSIAGSLLLGSGVGSRASREAEVVLVARVPGLMVPVRIPGVERAEVPETREGAILLVRQPVAGKVNLEPASDEGGDPP